MGRDINMNICSNIGMSMNMSAVMSRSKSMIMSANGVVNRGMSMSIGMSKNIPRPMICQASRSSMYAMMAHPLPRPQKQQDLSPM
jgi:hypothetical protein